MSPSVTVANTFFSHRNLHGMLNAMLDDSTPQVQVSRPYFAHGAGVSWFNA